MGLLFVCLVAHDLESRRWPCGVDLLICQTFAASPAEPGELLFWFRGNGHMVMIEKNSLDIAKLLDEWIQTNVK